MIKGGGKCSTALHVCRAVCRRAERATIPLLERNDIDEEAYKYLNRYLFLTLSHAFINPSSNDSSRLSDFFFVAARWSAKKSGHQDVVYKKPKDSE